MIHASYYPSRAAVKYHFSLVEKQDVLILPVGDVHAGSKGWPGKKFAEHILWGVDRGAYFLGMGEYLDFTSGSQRAVLKALRGSQLEQLDEMMRERVEKLYELMKSSTGRWLGMLEGHHYHEFQDGTTTDQLLAEKLGTVFFGTSALIDLGLGEGKHTTTVTIYAHHGAGGGGRKQGSHLHRIEDLVEWIEADIYLMGHTHAKVCSPMDRLYHAGKTIYHKTKLLARTGGFLRGYVPGRIEPNTSRAALSRGSYVEMAALTPSALGGVAISVGRKRVTNGGTVDIVVPDIHASV